MDSDLDSTHLDLSQEFESFNVALDFVAQSKRLGGFVLLLDLHPLDEIGVPFRVCREVEQLREQFVSGLLVFLPRCRAVTYNFSHLGGWHGDLDRAFVLEGHFVHDCGGWED